ncbi:MULTISPECIES: SIMPL domain-containing protein [unclassified Gordonia (in: high G+C Gram-positive bacteria)]
MRRPVPRAVAALAATLVLLAVTLLAGCGGDDGSDKTRTVTVVGSGKVTGVPDTLRADVGVEATGPDVSTALNESNATVKKVTDAVVAAGVDRKDVATQNVSLTPQYSTPAPGGTNEITGYQASNTIRITMHDTAKASQVLSAAATAGGDSTRINNVAFSIDDDSTLLEQARKAAFDDARTRASQYASLAGDSLGKVITITESSGDAQPQTPQRSSDVAVSAVPLEPGQQTVSFTVTVTYALT